MHTFNSRTARKRFISGCAVALLATAAFVFQQTRPVRAAVSTLVTAVTVPWQGITTSSHPIGDVAGSTTIFMQGVVYAAGTSDYTCAGIAVNGIKWDFGDGSPVQTVGCGAGGANLGVSHTYPVAIASTPYTAVLTITDTAGNTSSANFRIQVQPKSIDLEANMAIDRGLWWLHTQMTRSTSGSPAVKIGTWNNSSLGSATATAVNAMEVNNHLPSGNALTNPYVDDVQRGLAYLTSALSVQALTNQPGVTENPDTNGNTIGLRTIDGQVNYTNGMLMSAFVSSGTPNAIAPLGVVGSPIQNGVKGRTYKDLVQDMNDYNNWSQIDAGNVARTGSWYYTPANNATNVPADTSVAQWPAIGAIAARDGAGFNLTTPQWVLDRANAWLLNCQRNGGTADGAFDYACTNSIQQAYSADTPAGMIMGEMAGWLNDPAAATTNEVRFQRAVGFITRDWTCTGGFGCRTYNNEANFYAYFALAKAFRLAKPTQVLTLKYPTGHALAGQAFDWYANDPTTAQQTAGHAVGMARMVIRQQAVAGNFTSVRWVGNSHLATAMGIIILSPAVFELGPTAVCAVDATVTCSAGATCGAANAGEYAPVNFSGAGSFHNDPTGSISSYVWNFQDGTPNVTNVTATHSFSPATTPTTFNVQLTVTDTKGHTSAATCPVQVVSSALPPVSVPGGPYTVCQGFGLSLTLSGTGSFGRGSNIASYAWDWTNPVNFASADATTATTTWSNAYVESLAPGTYDVGLRVSDDSSAHYVTDKFTTVTVKANNDPSCNQPPVAVNDSASTFSGTAVAINVTSNDTDPDAGNTLTVTSTSGGPASGSVALSGGGSVTYTPVNGFAGTVTFNYTISDGHGGTASATVTVIVSKREVTATAGSGSNVYDGVAHAPSACAVTGAFTGDLTCANSPATAGPGVGTTAISPAVSGSNLDNYNVTLVDGSYSITKADATCTVTGYNVTFDDAAHTATGTCTGVEGALSGLDLSGSTHTAAGSYTDTWTFTDATGNYNNATGTVADDIGKAPSVTVVTCPASLVYTGSALTPCSANVTGIGGLNQAVTPVTYTSNTNVGTASANATFTGDANHLSSTDGETFEITQAATSTAINAPTITVAANGLVTVTVTSGSGTVLGNVSLTVDGGAAVTQTLSSGSTTFTVMSPNAGDHALVATYAAQGNFSASGATGNLHVNPSPTATTLTTSATPQLAGTPVTFTATVVSTAPGSGTPNGIVTFKEGATVLGTGTLNGVGVATFTTTTLSNGPHAITASYDGVNNYLPSNANTVSKLIFGLASGGGTFVIGDNNATLGNTVNFWGSQWEKNNSMTGGSSNNSFKGFAITPAVPTVGATFTSAPGNSAPPPAGVPQYLGIIVTSKVTKSGSKITGTIVQLVVVLVNPGYSGNPGHAGTGTIVAFVQ